MSVRAKCRIALHSINWKRDFLMRKGIYSLSPAGRHIAERSIAALLSSCPPTLLLEHTVYYLEDAGDEFHRPVIHAATKALLNFVRVPTYSFCLEKLLHRPLAIGRSMTHEILDVGFNDRLRV